MIARVKGFQVSPERKDQANEGLNAAYSVGLNEDTFNFRSFGNKINSGNLK